MKRILKLVILMMVVLWVYGVLYYEPVIHNNVNNECNGTISINNCYVLSTEK